MSYKDYLEYQIEKDKRELKELPDTDNFLSVLLEYYSFKSAKRSVEVLIVNAVVGLFIFAITSYLKTSFLPLALYFWGIQSLMFAIGFYLKYKYNNT